MKLFELYAELGLDTAEFDTKIKSATEAGKSLAESIGADASSIKSAFSDAFSFSVGQLMADGFQSGLGFIKDFSTESITAASNLEEVYNVIDKTFGEDAAGIKLWAADAKNAFGMSRLAALDYVGEMGTILKTQGFANDQVRDMSKNIVQLAADYASFKNMDFEDTFSMLRSGLRGETESIERLGLSVHVGTMIDWLGLPDEKLFTKGLSQMEQTLARYDFIMEKSDFVKGDFAQTSDSFANQLRILNSNIEELQTNMGEEFLPVASGFLQLMNFFFEDTKSVDEAVGDMRETFADTYTSIETTTANALSLVEALKELEEGGISSDEENVWSKLVNDLKTDIPALGAVIPDTTTALTEGTEALKGYIQEWRNLQLEAGRNEVLQEYYNVLGEKQAAYAKEKTEFESLTKKAAAGNQLYSQTWTKALQYLYDAYGETPLTQDEIANIISSKSGQRTAMQSLNALSNRGDAGASAFYDVLSNLVTPEDYSRQLALEQHEMDSAFLEMEDAADSLNVLMDAIDTLTGAVEDQTQAQRREEDPYEHADERTQETDDSASLEATVLQLVGAVQNMTDSMATMKSDVLAAVQEGVGNISVTGQVTAGNVMLNTGQLVGHFSPYLNLFLGRARLGRG